MCDCCFSWNWDLLTVIWGLIWSLLDFSENMMLWKLNFTWLPVMSITGFCEKRLEQLKLGKPQWILLEIRGETHKQGHGVNSDTSVSRQLIKSVFSVQLDMKENTQIALSPTLCLAASCKRMSVQLDSGCLVNERSCFEWVCALDIGTLDCSVFFGSLWKKWDQWSLHSVGFSVLE